MVFLGGLHPFSLLLLVLTVAVVVAYLILKVQTSVKSFGVGKLWHGKLGTMFVRVVTVKLIHYSVFLVGNPTCTYELFKFKTQNFVG